LCYPTSIEMATLLIAFSYKFPVWIHLMVVWVIRNMCHSDKICVDWCFVLVKFCAIRVK
jgi:NAD-dependent dihydropyrimidine dehydrogenase PreA subunit